MGDMIEVAQSILDLGSESTVHVGTYLLDQNYSRSIKDSLKSLCTGHIWLYPFADGSGIAEFLLRD